MFTLMGYRPRCAWPARFSRQTVRLFILSCCFYFISHGTHASGQGEPTNAAPVMELKLSDYLQQVLKQNDEVQAQMLETEAGRRKAKSELGIFEPDLEASVVREANQRTNNTQQQAAQNGESFFSEQNTIYDGGLEQLVPTGGKVRLGYTLSDLNNNVNPYGSVITTTNNPFIKQYQTFMGLTFTQPLLKDGGLSATMAGIRLGALDSDIAFQQYRRQLMLTVFQAESSYWNLYFAQEQILFFDDSVAVAQEVLTDSRQKLKAGQGAADELPLFCLVAERIEGTGMANEADGFQWRICGPGSTR